MFICISPIKTSWVFLTCLINRNMSFPVLKSGFWQINMPKALFLNVPPSQIKCWDGKRKYSKVQYFVLVLRFEHFLLWKSSVFGLYLNINNVRSLIDDIAPAMILRNTHSILSQIPYKAPSMCRCMGTRLKTRLTWSPWSKILLSSLSCCFENQVNSYNFPPQKPFEMLQNTVLPFCRHYKEGLLLQWISGSHCLFPFYKQWESVGPFRLISPSHWSFSLYRFSLYQEL